MKKLTLFAVLAASLLAAACSKYKYETVEGDPLQTRIYTLDNGLKVYMSVNRETPRIQTYIAVRVGGKNDPHETTGLAHYFEHLMFKGTPHFGTSDYAAEEPLLDQIEELFEHYRQTSDEAERAAIYHRIDSISYEASKIAIPNEYDKLMAAIGADGTNAYTSQDMTVYVEDIPSNQIDNWARIEADRFKHPVIRGFHTELETIYEEKNMSLTRDSRKVWEALDAALFQHHPYGTQTVLGTQEHLKNPSITNVKNYHKTYYVPNNMAICVSGDFNPDEMVAAIEKYFGDMEPNPELPVLQFEPEEPIASPIVREVFGLEAENVMLGWRLPGASAGATEVAEIAGAVLYNGQAGLIDLDITQQQRTLAAYGYPSFQPDYGTFLLAGRPKADQTLDEVRDLLLAEVAKLRAGDFDEALIKASVNNTKLQLMRTIEHNSGRADMYVQSFINGTDWADDVKMLERLDKVTKEDVVAWANEYLGPENYAIIYKRLGKDPDEQKIAAPKITPIVTNRDMQSAFLTEIQQSQVKPIEPRFVDFDRDMERCTTDNGIELLVKQEPAAGLFQLTYAFPIGASEDPALQLAFEYADYLGTAERSAEEFARAFYDIACSTSFRVGNDRSYLTISGLSENMEQAIRLTEEWIAGAVADENVLANIKDDLFVSRINAKRNQSAAFAALQRYIFFGPEELTKMVLSNAAAEAITSEELLAKLHGLFGKQHTILYYGPRSAAETRAILAANHRTPETLEAIEIKVPQPGKTDKNRVVLAQYDANQLYYIQYSNRGERFDVAYDPEITLYNEYFGGSMNAIVFQEMREARGLAYSAWASLRMPGFASQPYTYMAFIATQNDKMQQAIEAFDEIINNMPESEAAFEIAKKALLERIRTQRTVKADILTAYLDACDMQSFEDRNRAIFERVQAMTLDDVKAAQQQWVKGRPYVYAILGNIKDLDLNYLKTLGPIQTVSQEDIFGY